MMATTHVFAGLAIVAPLAHVAPEFAVPLAAGAIAGGLFPDFDLAFEHRRTLHFPVYGSVLAVLATIGAVLVPSSPTVGFAAFAVAAWLHAASDALGNGPEFDPWTDARENAVYNHFAGRWMQARRYVRYDGAPEDFALGLALAVPALVVFDGRVRVVVAAALVPAFAYTIFRRQVADLVPAWLE